MCFCDAELFGHVTIALDLLKFSPSALSMVCDTRKGKKNPTSFCDSWPCQEYEDDLKVLG